MSYEPTTWANGDIITATKLNNIESGVQSVSSSYTPTTWATGDIITAVKLNNIEQGIANAGGGSSDFSTAIVTIDSQNAGLVGILHYGMMSPYFAYSAQAQAFGGEPTEIPIILYQGQIMLIKEDATLTISSVSGNINYDSGEDMYTITGDCTITIS